MEIEKISPLHKEIELLENLEDLAQWVRAHCYEVEACGRDGELEMGKIKELVPKVLKGLVNYL